MSNEKQKDPQKELDQAGEMPSEQIAIPDKKPPDDKKCKATKIKDPTKPHRWTGFRNEKSLQQWLLVIFTGILAFITGILAFYTYGLFSITTKQTNIVKDSVQAAQESAEAAVAAQRPWISVDVEIEDPLIITEEEIRIELKLIQYNSGNTPAVNIRVIPQLAAVPIKDGLDLEAGIKKAIVISNNWSSHQHRIGRTIFPKRTAIERHVVQLPRSEILEAVSAGDRADPSRIILNLGGCVDYTFVGGKGQTTFSFVLMVRSTGHMGIEIHPRKIASDQLILKEQIVGVYAK